MLHCVCAPCYIAASEEFVGGGAQGEGQTQSSLGFILQQGVTMETASSLVKMAAAVWQQ